MDPLAILGLIQLGASLIGGFQAQQEASRRQAMMDAMLGKQVESATAALNAVLQAANRNYAGQLSPYYSAIEGRAMQSARAATGQAGLNTSGLATAVQADISSQIGADFLRALTEIDERNLQRLMAAQTNLAQIFGQQAQLQGQLSQAYGQMGPDLSWLPILASANPDVLGRIFSWLNFGNMFGGQPAPAGTPGAPSDVIPPKMV